MTVKNIEGVMTTALVDSHLHRRRFFEVLPETGRTQAAVMTIAPGEGALHRVRNPGPEPLFFRTVYPR